MPLEDILTAVKILSTWAKWQDEFVKSKEPQLLLFCGRKAGKTEAAAIKIVYEIMERDFSHTDGICVTSVDFRAAKALLFKVKTYLQMCGIQFANDWHIAEREGTCYATQTALYYNVGQGKWNKVQVFAMGFDGSSMRPYSFWKTYRDEDQHSPDDADQAVGATLAVHGIQEIRMGTGGSPSGTFWRAYTSGQWRIWNVRSDTCPHVSKDFLKRERKRLGNALYEMEYGPAFLDGLEGVYTRELLTQATAQGMQTNWDEIEKLPLYIGVDFARGGEDENAIAFAWFDRTKMKIYIRQATFHSKYYSTEVVNRIVAYTNKYTGFKKVITDSNGVGSGPTDQLMVKLGRGRVIGIKNQQKLHDNPEEPRGRSIKMVMHMHLLRRLENEEIVLEDDSAIISSLRSMKLFHNERNEVSLRGRNNHIAEAMVRAIYPLKYKKKGKAGGGIYVHVIQETLNAEEEMNKLW